MTEDFITPSPNEWRSFNWKDHKLAIKILSWYFKNDIQQKPQHWFEF